MFRTLLVRFVPPVAATIVLAGCGRGAPPDPAAPVPAPLSAPAVEAAPSPPAAGATPGLPADTAGRRSLSGEVLETRDAGGYTYLRLRTGDGDRWTAIARASVPVGARATVREEITFTGFESRSLRRTFDVITFGVLVDPAAAAGDPRPAPAAATPQAAMRAAHAGARAPVVPDRIDVPLAEGPDARRVAELFSDRGLRDRTVAVRGVVVKFLPGIMGRNWIHLRDGTGSAPTRDDDLTVTTGDRAEVGETVQVRGTVRRDKDFGAGYAYLVLIEEARVTR